jgi:hypothetical protein
MASESRWRVLLALDGGQPDERVLRTVWRLLRADHLELVGLYVEDEDLLRAAALPCLREVSLSGRESALDTARLAADMAGQAALARTAFEGLAQRFADEAGYLGHRFTVTRGRFAEVFGRAAGECDFVMVTRPRRAPSLRRRIGSELPRLLSGPKHVLFVNEPWASGSSVVALHGSDAALEQARRLAEAEGLKLVLALPPGAPPPPAERLPPGTRVRQLARWEEQDIAELCLHEDARVLVMPQRTDLDWAELLISLVDRLPCSLLKLAP